MLVKEGVETLQVNNVLVLMTNTHPTGGGGIIFPYTVHYFISLPSLKDKRLELLGFFKERIFPSTHMKNVECCRQLWYLLVNRQNRSPTGQEINIFESLHPFTVQVNGSSSGSLSLKDA